MAIQSSGQIKISDLVTEFGGTAPHGLAEYYRGGGLCTNNNTNVPTSGEIKLSQFYSATGAVTVTCSNGQTDLSADTLFGSDFTGSIPKILIIPSGAEIGATSISARALTVPTGMGGTLDIQNSGTISGAGGAGGSGGVGGNSHQGDPGGTGGAGGSAILVNVAGVTVTNSGTIRGGGGGGGGGAAGGRAGSRSHCNGSNTGGTGGAGGRGQGHDGAAASGSGGGGSSRAFCNGNHQSFCNWFCPRIGAGLFGGSGGGGGTGGAYGAAGSDGGNGGVGQGTGGIGGQGGSGGTGGTAGKYIEVAGGISLANTPGGTLEGSAP